MKPRRRRGDLDPAHLQVPTHGKHFRLTDVAGDVIHKLIA
jgi:hypothetical protein